MVQFTKLRLSGFKSFVEPTELLIEPGLTGVVGPNGCGKSNLLEGLRWVMGETRPSKLRGGEMDDVIFGGTSDRPARNLAEVVILLDNSSRNAPAAFNDHDEIEVVRRIERGSGSHYRINGKDVRARDVQLVFADAATGARSTALVSQGRIGALINAKPTDRRGLLEEAAGITGLHSRRHEAELRLRAAENNLERLDDVVTALESQLQGLKRQARQATRYRNISDHIRKAESILLHLRWREATAEREAAAERLRQVDEQVTVQAKQVAEATGKQAESAEALGGLRQEEAEAAAALHRLTVARDQLDAEDQRIAEARKELETRLAQIAADTERERALAADAGAMLQRLEQEKAALLETPDDEDSAREEAETAVAAARSDVEATETALTACTERLAAADARRAAHDRNIAETAERLERRRSQLAAVTEERSALEAGSEAASAIATAETDVASARTQLDRARSALDAEAAKRADAEAEEAKTRTALQERESELSTLRAETMALAQLLDTGDPEQRPPILDDLSVQAGCELALAAALGDDLSAPADDAAPVHWRDLPISDDAPPLPDGAEPLSAVVRAPGVLARRLAQIGLVSDAAAGRALQTSLQTGQRLVSRDGALWRWDGYTVAAGAQTGAAARLEHRNRLSELEPSLIEAAAQAEKTHGAAEAAKTAAGAAAEAERAARKAADEAFALLSTARDKLAELTERAAADTSRLAALVETGTRLEADVAEAEAALTALRDDGDIGADPEADREEQARLRSELTAQRGVLIDCQQKFETIRREIEARRLRLEDIETEGASWRSRAATSESQLAQLEERRVATAAGLARLADRPAEIAEQRQGLMDDIEAAEANRRAAADRLAEAENLLKTVETSLKAAESRLADLREERGLSEGIVRQAEQACATVAERISERLGCAPEGALAAGSVKEGETLPELEAIETRLARLLKERDNMGPVNLRAEQEAKDLADQIESLETERADLIAAINKFRQAIGELNREGRERLRTSFEEVNTHFRELFERLFGGGRAHLSLTESDDPLEAGLEIMASPPGKRLQVLSLLSGGEQALTALALLFAVFMTNPAPVCVLDEVDAPLDDANVDRFCTLIEELAHNTSTRFLLITHHRMSMARMDRLFGVTMPERGVSQLVSVDLQRAEQIRESA